MNQQIFMTGITFEELQEKIQQIVRNEVLKITDAPSVQTNNSDPEFITRKETAQILGVSLPTLHEWTKNGIIPAHRIGTRVRYQKNDVYASLRSIDTIKFKRY